MLHPSPGLRVAHRILSRLFASKCAQGPCSCMVYTSALRGCNSMTSGLCRLPKATRSLWVLRKETVCILVVAEVLESGKSWTYQPPNVFPNLYFICNPKTLSSHRSGFIIPRAPFGASQHSCCVQNFYRHCMENEDWGTL